MESQGSLLKDFSGSSMLEAAKEILPPGHEFLGFGDGLGREWTVEEIKAIESLERDKMRLQTDTTPAPKFSNETLRDSINDVLQENRAALMGDKVGTAQYVPTPAAKPIKSIEKIFFLRSGSMLALRDDKTLWLFNEECTLWEEIKEFPKTPPIPQD
jgi:hypothetical protein